MSHVMCVESVSMWRLSCRSCIVYSDSCSFVYGFVLYCEMENGALAELHLLTRCMRWAGDCGRRKSAKIYDSNRHFSACWLHLSV